MVAVLWTAAACAQGSGGPTDADPGVPDAASAADANVFAPDADPSAPDASPGGDRDGDEVADAADNCPDTANPDQLDGDIDDIGNACDCDPSDPNIAAYLVVEDGQAETAPGFSASSWTLSGGRYEQTTVANDADDASFVVLDDPPAASTEVQDFGTDDLRQVFVTARGSSGASYGAAGCGIELIESGGSTDKTVSAVALGGSPDAVTTSPADRATYPGVGSGEEFDIRLDLRGGQMTCAVTKFPDTADAATTVAQAGGFAEGAGAVGFHTRETAAVFTDVRVCRQP